MEVVSESGQALLDLTQSLMTLERRPLQQVQVTRNLVDTQITERRSLASKLSSLRRLASDFTQTGALSPLRTFKVTGNGGGAFTATAGPTASAGIHSVQVLGLAARHSLASTAIEAGGRTLASASSVDQKFTFEVTAGGVTTEIQVEVDPEADDEAILRAVVDAIDQSDAEITATVARVSSGERKLLIQAKGSGIEAQVTSIRDLEGSLFSRLGLGSGRTEDGQLGGTVQAAADARLVVDGLEITAASNKIENVISGVSLQLSSTTTGVQSMEIARDPDAVLGEIRSLIDSYNEALDDVRSATRPSDDSGANRGLLADDTSFRSLRTGLRSVLAAPVELDSGVQTLASIGITADREGRISLNESDLRAALESDPETVEAMIGGENGVAGRLTGLLDGYSKVGGIIDKQIDSAERRRDLYDARITSLSETLALKEESLFQQLARLQAAIGGLVSQQNYLSSFFASGS